MAHFGIYGKENWEGHKRSETVENQFKEPLPHKESQSAVRNNRKEQNISKGTSEHNVGAK